MSKLVNSKEIVLKAYQNQYAIPHININNAEWTKRALLAAQEMQSPLILGVSESAIKYIGGYHSVVGMVKGMLIDLNISVPIVLHLDHGSKQACLEAIDAGFSSVMFDGSAQEFVKNMLDTQQIVEYAKKFNVSVEAEVGTIGGEEDGVISTGELTNLEQAKQFTQLDIDMFAAGIGNIHGKYPSNWKGLDFALLQDLKNQCNIPLVLHGGSGIPFEQIKQAISLGVAKINVNTELQIVFHQALREFIKQDKDLIGKNFDVRKLLLDGFNAIQHKIKEIIINFGSHNKA
ncbi:class II fructose-1,6-bisphosphate aldolase [Mycoplasmopsis phocirhinis]|uniref:Class II fructose-1,6-bisphosphate aldolase n=1 Tax=Mycoplasmopsis phocirhinis TaxID=142650 RepID=A0A4P6MMP7_9BACT|nr:class II fructose-1,6-bisphosphate aldolase [Mycoplasmopsis phocirhinis]QBF34788.1 class II fructose-1,6-bisphosphate aldolase [Mycoplasmopsis phocirhinis]